jgi:uncharacterized protein
MMQFRIGERKCASAITTYGGKMDAKTEISKDLSDGLAAYKQQNYEEALKLLLPIAEAGNPEAQFRVGDIYDEGGYGVQQDDETAWNWLNKAANQGHILALSALLLLNVLAEFNNSLHVPKLENLDVEKETDKCIADLTVLAEKNDCEAICLLGSLLAFSSLSENKIKKAANYALKGAQLDDPECMVLLGMLLPVIGDLEGNYLSNTEWYEKAYKLGSRLAGNQLGDAYRNGRGVKRDTRKAFQFFEEAAQKGSAGAALSAGKCKAYGIGTCHCDAAAYRWFSFAAKNGEREAQYYLATIENTLSSIQLPDEEQIEWLTESARRGFSPAIYELGNRLLYGHGVERNVERGIHLIRQAASLSNADAQFMLGRFYEMGEYLPYNPRLSINCYIDAAKNGSLEAHVYYGLALLNGDGVGCDPEAAEYHFTKAFEQGEPQGAIGLGYLYASKRERVKALGYVDYAIGLISDNSAERVGSFRDNLIDDMTDAEIYEAKAYARQAGYRGTA